MTNSSDPRIEQRSTLLMKGQHTAVARMGARSFIMVLLVFVKRNKLMSGDPGENADLFNI